MNKRNFIAIFMILLFLASSITVIAANPFRTGAFNIDNFIRGGWRGYDEVILFVLLFILFTAAFVLALGKAFGETNRQVKVIAVVIALMSALSIVATTKFSLENMAYIALGLAFLILVLLIQGILLKMGIKSKLAAFILALLIALLLTFLLARLLSEMPSISLPGIKAPSWWHDLNLLKLKKGLKLEFVKITPTPTPAPQPEGLEEITPAPKPAPTPKTDGAKPIPPTKKREWPNLPWWAYLLPLLIPLIWGLKKWRKRPKKEKEPGKEPTEEDIKKIIKEVEEIVKLKKDILKRITEIVDKKKELSDKMVDLYHKTIRHEAYYLDRSSPEFKNLMEEDRDAAKLLKLEHELEEWLKELMEKEDDLIKNKLSKWLNVIRSFYGEEKSPEEKIMFERLPPYAKIEHFSKALKGIVRERGGYDDYCRALGKLIESFKMLSLEDEYKGEIRLSHDIKEMIIRYFSISKGEIVTALRIRKLTEYKDLEKWFKEGKYEKWKDIRYKLRDDLRIFFEKEKELLLGKAYPTRIERGYSLYSKIHHQAGVMLYIIELIKFLESKKKSYTELQPLGIDTVETKYKDLKKEKVGRFGRAYEMVIIPPDNTIKRVYTRMQQGIGPFTCMLYIDDERVKISGRDYKIVGSEEECPSKGSFPEVEFTSEEAPKLRGLTLGEGVHGMPSVLTHEPHMLPHEGEVHGEVHGGVHGVVPAAKGEYTITIVAMSPGANVKEWKAKPDGSGEIYPVYEKGTGTYRRHDWKSIKIYIGIPEMPGVPPHEVPHETPRKGRFERLKDWLESLWNEIARMVRLKEWLKRLLEWLKRLLERLKREKGEEAPEAREVEGLIHDVEELIREVEEAHRMAEAAARAPEEEKVAHEIVYEAEEVSRWAKFKKIWDDLVNKIRSAPGDILNWLLQFIRNLILRIVARAKGILKRAEEIEEAYGIPHEAIGKIPPEFEELLPSPEEEAEVSEAHEYAPLHAPAEEATKRETEEEIRILQRVLEWLRRLLKRLLELLDNIREEKESEPKEVREVEEMVEGIKELILQAQEAHMIAQAVAEEPERAAHEAEEAASKFARFKAVWSSLAKNITSAPSNKQGWVLGFIKALRALIVSKAKDTTKRAEDIEEAHNLQPIAPAEMPKELEEAHGAMLSAPEAEKAHTEIMGEKERLHELRGSLVSVGRALTAKKEAEPEKAAEIEADKGEVKGMITDVEGVIRDLEQGATAVEESAHGIEGEEIAQEIEDVTKKSRLRTWWGELASNIRKVRNIKELPSYIISTFSGLLGWVRIRGEKIEHRARIILSKHAREIYEANTQIQEEKSRLRRLKDRAKQLRLSGVLERRESNRVSAIEKEAHEMGRSINSFDAVFLLIEEGKEGNARSAIKRAKDRVNTNFKWLINLWSGISKNIKEGIGFLTGLLINAYKERESELSESLERIETEHGLPHEANETYTRLR